MQKHNQNHAPSVETAGETLSKATVARLLSSTSILAAKGIVAAALLALPVQLDLSGGDHIVTIEKAHAESGSGSGGSGSGGSDNSGSGSGSGGGGNSGPGSGGGGGDDNSGPGSGGGNDNDGGNSGPGSGGNNDSDGDNSGPGHGGDNDDGDRDDNDDRDDGDAADNGNNNAARPEIVVDLSQSDLTAVLNGSKILVDNLGRVLEVEIELEHGVTTVIAKPHGGDAQRNPGPIDSFTIVTR
jgi:hypothetical protein